MRVTRPSPLFRIALLSLAVLFAHTLRANTQPILPASPPSPGKVAAAQPDSRKKPPLATTQIVKPRNLHNHNWFGGSFQLAGAHASILLDRPDRGPTVTARAAIHTRPQRRPFDLRI